MDDAHYQALRAWAAVDIYKDALQQLSYQLADVHTVEPINQRPRSQHAAVDR